MVTIQIGDWQKTRLRLQLLGRPHPETERANQEIHGEEISPTFSACPSHPQDIPRSLRVFRDEFDAQPFQLACEDPSPAGTALHVRWIHCGKPDMNCHEPSGISIFVI